MRKIDLLKKTVSAFCAGCLVILSFPMSFRAASATATTTDYLNLREGAGTNTRVILTLPKNTTVSILDNSDAQWAKVKTSSGKTGYCFKQYLSFSSSSGQTSSGTNLTATTTANLNLRQEASLRGKILRVMPKGTAVTVLDNSNSGWVKVQTSSGTQGWCSRQYLTISGSSTSTDSNSTTSSITARTTAYLHLRTGPGLSNPVILTMSKGLAVTVLDNSNPDWVRVCTPSGTLGWCSRQYLTISDSSSSTESNSTASSMTARTTDYLNLRTGPGLSNRVILTMSKGLTVTVLDHSNSDWFKVRTPSGTQGWCSRRYLTITKSADTADTNQSASSSPSSMPSSSSASSESTENSDDSEEEDSDSGLAGITGATVTADVLRLRGQPNTSSTILTNLVYGTKLQVLSAPASGWVKVQTSDGKIGYVSTDYVIFQNSDGTSTGGSSGTGTTAATLSLSSGAQTVPVGKTLYLKATTNPSSADVSWTSSDTSVATVVNGYVTAVAKGSAVITAKSGSATAACSVTVVDAEPVRTAYASPNIAGPGEQITLIAITDTSRDGVRFYVTKPTGDTTVIEAVSSTSETTNGVTTKVWKATTTFNDPGSYTILAQSRSGGSYSSTGFTTSAYVTEQNDKSVTTSEERRVSDEMLELIAKWEGYRSYVYTDTISSSQVPTIGYGCTLGANAQFYNGISKTEAWSIMVNRINNSSYTSELNKMIRKNGFLMNQYQADCLISFAYNVGSGYFNSSTEMDFIKIMKNAVRPPDFSSGTSYQATVTKGTQVRDNTGILSNQIASVTAGTSVTVIDGDFSDKNDGWYKVELEDGTVGWINSGYVSLENSDELVHDLNYTNAYAFGTELIRWNQAGGKFYTGLFYRRLGEANVYNYGDYSAVRYNKYGYGYPLAASSLK
jgi:uncharacterized protein YgiM (DUF1202 family)